MKRSQKRDFYRIFVRAITLWKHFCSTKNKKVEKVPKRSVPSDLGDTTRKCEIQNFSTISNREFPKTKKAQKVTKK